MYLDGQVFGNVLGFSGCLLLDLLRFISYPLFVSVGKIYDICIHCRGAFKLSKCCFSKGKIIGFSF